MNTEYIIHEKAVDDIVKEYNSAARYGHFRSRHEGYAILLEEVDELWDEVKKSPTKMDREKLREEAKQVAAMALKFMVMLDMGTI